MVPQNSKNSNVYLNWSDIENLVQKAVEKMKIYNRKYDAVIGITNGGIVPARLIARETNIDNINFIYMSNKQIQNNILSHFSKDKKYLMVDDIYDSGRTFTSISRLLETIKIEYDFMFLLSRYKIKSNLLSKSKIFVGKCLNHERWIVFPWEKR